MIHLITTPLRPCVMAKHTCYECKGTGFKRISLTSGSLAPAHQHVVKLLNILQTNTGAGIIPSFILGALLLRGGAGGGGRRNIARALEHAPEMPPPAGPPQSLWAAGSQPNCGCPGGARPRIFGGVHSRTVQLSTHLKGLPPPYSI
jgi:hypothetical protein